MSRARWIQVGLLALLAGILVAIPPTVMTETSRETPYGACFSTDGTLVARSTSHGTAVFDIRTRESWQIPDGGHLAFSPDANLLACGSKSALTIWDWRTAKYMHRWEGNSRWFIRIAISPDGKLVAGMDDDAIRVWDVQKGNLLLTIPLPFGHSVLLFSPDSTMIIAGATVNKADGKGNHEIRLWTVPEGQLHAVLIGPEHCHIRAIAASADGKHLAAGLSINEVRLWNIESRAEVWLVPARMGYNGLTFSRDNKSLVAGDWKTTIFDVANPSAPHTVFLPSHEFNAVAPDADSSRFLVSASDTAHAVSVNGGIAAVVEGLKVRSRCQLWVLVVVVLTWLLVWPCACLGVWLMLPRERRMAELYASAVVLAVACVSVVHWLLFANATRSWHLHMVDPADTLSMLSVGWLLVLGAIVAPAIFFCRSRMGVAATAFSALAAVGQLAFDGYLLAVATTLA